MRRIFTAAVIGAFLSPALAMAEDAPDQAGQDNVYAALPNLYTEEEMEFYRQQQRYPLTPRLRGILDTRYNRVEPYLIKSTFCTKDGEGFEVTLSFAARANEIAGAIAADREGFYHNLDSQAGQIDTVLREHFSGADGQTPQDFRNFLDSVQGSLSPIEGFNPYLSGSARPSPGGCLFS